MRVGLDRARASGKTIGRKPAHIPADDLTKLRAGRVTLEQIAARNGVSVMTVRRRLRAEAA